ncbi:MAG: CHAT domain-containing protein [Planctomycetes bacterium]|nr:CHAT domain-containing protein [Planctomycetota bacterium]
MVRGAGERTAGAPRGVHRRIARTILVLAFLAGAPDVRPGEPAPAPSVQDADPASRGDVLHDKADQAYGAAMDGLRWLAKYAGDLADPESVRRSSKLYWSLLIARLDASSFPVAGMDLRYAPAAPEDGGPTADDLTELARFFTEASRAFFRSEDREPRDVVLLYEALAFAYRALGDRWQADADRAYREAIAAIESGDAKDDPAAQARLVTLRFNLREFDAAVRTFEEGFLPARRKGTFPAQDEVVLLRVVRDAARFRGDRDRIARLDEDIQTRGAKAGDVARPMAEYGDPFLPGSAPDLERMATILQGVRASYRLDARDATLADYLGGAALLAAGAPGRAIASLRVAAGSPDPWTSAAASFRLGLARERIGEFEPAASDFAAASEAGARLAGMSRFRARASINRASVLCAIGKRLQAEDALLALVQTGGLEPIDVARARILLGNISFARAKDDPALLEEARATYLRAEKDIARKDGPDAAELRWLISIDRANVARAEALGTLSPAARQLGLERALALVRDVPSGAHAAGRHALAALAAGNAAELYLEIGDLEKAEAQARWALDAARTVASFDTEWRAHDILGRLAAARGDQEGARAAFAESARIVELFRSKVSTPEDRASFLEDRAEVFRHAVGAMLAFGDVEAAFAYAERGRARSLLEAMGARQLAFAVEADRKAFAEIQRAASRVEGARRGQGEVLGVGDRKAFDALLAELEGLRAEVAKRTDLAPETRYLASGRPAGLKEVQACLAQDEALVSYYETGDGLAAIVATPAAAKTVRLEASIEGIRAQIRSFVAGGCRDKGLAESLHRALVAPILPEIVGPRVTIVPYGQLFRLPFEALWDGKSYLIERWEVTYLPSATILRFLSRRPEVEKRSLAAFLDPDTDYDADGRPDKEDLPFAGKELDGVEDRFPERTFLRGRDATEDACFALAPGRGILHFSCHGEFLEHDPLASALFLAKGTTGDGRLRAYEVFGLDLRDTDLVTMAACETSVAKVTSGQDQTGIAGVFLLAGARSLVASLWKVEDRATSDLMHRFYEILMEPEHGSKGAALRAAKLELLRSESTSDPWKWAPFILLGAR